MVFGIWGLGFGVDFGFGVSGFKLWVSSLGLRVWGLRFRVSGCRVTVGEVAAASAESLLGVFNISPDGVRPKGATPVGGSAVSNSGRKVQGYLAR